MLQSVDQPNKLRSFLQRRYSGLLFFASKASVPTLQWGVVGVVSTLLGVFVLFFDKLPQDFAPLFIIAILGFFFLMVVQDVRRILLAIVVLDVSIQLDIFLFFDEEILLQGSTSGFVVAGTTLSIVGLYALWISELLTKKETITKRPIFLFSLPPALYLGAEILSLVAAHNPMLTLSEVFLLTQMLFLYIYIVGTVQTRDEVLFIVMIMIIGLALQGLIIIGLRFYGQNIVFAGIKARVDGGRIGGTVGSPNVTAGYLSPILTLTAAVLLIPKLNTRWRWVAGVAFSLGIIGLVLTFSRGGWFGFIFSIGVLGLTAIQRGHLSKRVVALVLVVVLTLVTLFSGSISDRLTGDDNNSANSRIPLMRMALYIIKDHPIVGVGGNNFATRIPEYATREFNDDWLFAVHNKYLLVWAETGLFGLATFLAFLLLTLKRAWKGWQLGDDFYSFLQLGMGTGIMATIIHMNFDIFRNRASIQPLWMSAALITAIYCIRLESAKRDLRSLKQRRSPATQVKKTNNRLQGETGTSLSSPGTSTRK